MNNDFVNVTIDGQDVSVPVDLLAKPDAVLKIARDSETKLIIKTKFKPVLNHNAKSIFIEDLEYILDGQQAWNGKHEAAETDLVELVYTSGTTGDPKGVMLTHKNIVSNIVSMSEHLPTSEKDNMLSLLPLSHMFEQVPVEFFFVKFFQKGNKSFQILNIIFQINISFTSVTHVEIIHRHTIGPRKSHDTGSRIGASDLGRNT